MQVTIRRGLLTDDKREQMCDQRCDKYFLKKISFPRGTVNSSKAVNSNNSVPNSEDICLQIFLLLFNFETKEPFVSPADSSLVGIVKP